MDHWVRQEASKIEVITKAWNFAGLAPKNEIITV